MKISWKDWDEYDKLAEDACVNGTSVVECGFMYEYELGYGTWYRSKDKKETGSSPFSSFMLNKKWTMEEEFSNHMLRFQQVQKR